MQRFNGARISSFLLEKEKYVFLAVCFFTLFPIFTGQYFVTLDGPSHLYNAKVWSFLVFDSQPFLSSFYSVNALMPNVLSHFVLSLLLTFFPAFVAEKILVIAYIFLFAYSFRYLLKSFGESNILLAYFIFPFIFSYPFLLGFYNFSFAIVLLFFVIGYWLRHDHSRFSWRFLLGLTLLVFLTYTTHLILFGLLLFILALETGITGIILVQNKYEGRMKPILTRTLSALTASVLPLYFVYQYLAERPLSVSGFNYLNYSTLVRYLVDLRPIIAFDYENEIPFTRLILLVLLALFLIYFINRNRNKPPVDPNDRTKLLFAGIAPLAIFLLYFVLPDTDGRGSYVSIRWALLIFPFLILFLSLQKFSRTTLRITIPIVLIAHFALTAEYALINKQVSPVISEVLEVSAMIDPNSIVAVAKESGTWYMDHYSNYLGLEKPIVILENYEANNGYFPVVWNKEGLPNITLLNKPINSIKCLSDQTNIDGENQAVDYLVIIGNYKNLPSKCMDLSNLTQDAQFEKLYSSQKITLFKLK